MTRLAGRLAYDCAKEIGGGARLIEDFKRQCRDRARQLAEIGDMKPKLICMVVICVLGSRLQSDLLAQAAEPTNYLRAVVAELEKAWPTNRRVNIVCHGHSVPAGY